MLLNGLLIAGSAKRPPVRPEGRRKPQQNSGKGGWHDDRETQDRKHDAAEADDPRGSLRAETRRQQMPGDRPAIKRKGREQVENGQNHIHQSAEPKRPLKKRVRSRRRRTEKTIRI